MRAQTSRGAQGHGRVDSEFTGFVAGGGDDSALVGAAADHNRLAAEIGTVEELDGDEEGVHVNMEDGGHRWGFGGVGGVMFGSESRQVWHGSRVRL